MAVLRAGEGGTSSREEHGDTQIDEIRCKRW
jgi:hypothetical protein